MNSAGITVAATGSVRINSALGNNAILIGNTTTGNIQLGSITSAETKVTGASVLVDGTSVAVGGGSSTQGTTVGKAGVATSIRGTVSISQVYNLPITAPALNQVLGCDVLGEASWLTAVRSGYAFNPIVNGTTTITTGNKAYWFTCLINEPMAVKGYSIYVSGGGSDSARVGIYRGYLEAGAVGVGSTITLVGQSLSTALSSSLPFNRNAIIVAVGQSLVFAAGEYMTIAFHSSGISNVYVSSPASTNLVDISYTTTSNYVASGFPASVPQTSISTGNLSRPCFELY
jgi:hypothetical protein